MSNLSKVFEKFLKARLHSFFDNKVFSTQQYGFLKQCFTEDAILLLSEKIHGALEDRKACMCLLIELAKATKLRGVDEWSKIHGI